MGTPKKPLLLLLKLLVAAILTGLLVHYVSPAKIALALQSADPWLVLTFVPLMLVSMVFAALQIKVLTDCHGMDLSLMRIIGINASTQFYSLFLPGIISGGVIRWYRFSRDNKMRAQAVAVIIMNRLLTILVMLVIGILGWLLSEKREATPLAFWFMIACLLATAGSLLVSSNRPLESAVRRRLAKPDGLRPLVRDKLLKLIDAANEYRLIPNRGRLHMILYATGYHLAFLFSTYLLALALGVEVPVAVLAWVRAVVTMGLLLPVTISGFGIREGAWIYFLGIYGVAPATAFTLSLLTFVRTLFQAGIGCALEIRELFGAGKR